MLRYIASRMRRREKSLSEARVFKEIRNRWIWDPDHLRSVWRKKPVPDLQDLRILIETSFATNLKRDEGHRVRHERIAPLAGAYSLDHGYNGGDNGSDSPEMS